MNRHCLALPLALALLALVALAPPAQAAPRTVASEGRGSGQVEKPVGTAVEQSSGDLYVADLNNFRIDKFDPEGNFLEAWGFGVADNESAELQSCGPQGSPPTIKCFPANGFIASPDPGNIAPEGIAIDESEPTHYLYVADPSKHRVTKFTTDGKFVFMIGKNVDKGGGSPAHPGDICKAEYLQQAVPDTCGLGEAASGAGEYFGAPTSVTVAPSGNLWVGEDGRVLEFDSEGTFISEAAVPEGGGVVKGLALDPLVSGELWMKSQSLAGVRSYALSGAPPFQTLIEVGSPLDEGGQPEALVLDSAGNVYVGDATSPYRFKAYDPSGELFSQFGAGQVIGWPGAGGAGQPGGTPLAIDESAGALYAASSASGPASAVQRFALPEPGPLPEEARASGLLPTSATLEATLNPEGHPTAYRFQYLTRAAYEEQGKASKARRAKRPKKKRCRAAALKPKRSAPPSITCCPTPNTASGRWPKTKRARPPPRHPSPPPRRSGSKPSGVRKSPPPRRSLRRKSTRWEFRPNGGSNTAPPPATAR